MHRRTKLRLLKLAVRNIPPRISLVEGSRSRIFKTYLRPPAQLFLYVCVRMYVYTHNVCSYVPTSRIGYDKAIWLSHKSMTRNKWKCLFSSSSFQYILFRYFNIIIFANYIIIYVQFTGKQNIDTCSKYLNMSQSDQSSQRSGKRINVFRIAQTNRRGSI